jgi:hypothetical protein
MRLFVRTTIALTMLLVVAAPARAGAILPGFTGGSLAANDDGSTGLINIGFGIDFYGLATNQVYINNNGNITFSSPLGTYTPFPILTTGIAMIAPFFADIDTSSSPTNSELVTWGAGTFDGRTAFGINWGTAAGIGVDYYSASNTHTNSNKIQLVIVDRSDTGAGNFDFMFNYDLIQWETGGASGGDANGCGGFSARVGWSNGTTQSFELAGSAINGAFIDSGTCGGPGPYALILNSLNSNVNGRYMFSVREGEVLSTVPEPSTLLLLGGGLVALAAKLRSRRNAAR